MQTTGTSFNEEWYRPEDLGEEPIEIPDDGEPGEDNPAHGVDLRKLLKALRSPSQQVW